MQIGFITSNLGKLRELQVAVSPLGHNISRLSIAYPEIQADSIDKVAKFGLNWIIDMINSDKNSQLQKQIENLDLFILEDSGLFVHALNNFPGVYSKFVFKTVGCLGILELMRHKTDRAAHFESCIAILRVVSPRENNLASKHEVRLFKGICNGDISHEQRGEKGFGFDPIFIPHGKDRTFAQMETAEKNLYSHRGKAVAKLLEFLGIL